MNGLAFPHDEEIELLRLTQGVRWVTKLEELWSQVQLEEAKKQCRALNEAM
jgi:hypothetical protein